MQLTELHNKVTESSATVQERKYANHSSLENDRFDQEIPTTPQKHTGGIQLQCQVQVSIKLGVS